MSSDAIATIARLVGPDISQSMGAGTATFDGCSIEWTVLYDELIVQGSTSEVEALRVGVIIDETDIDDLNAAIASTKRKDIKTVYSNLPQGSLNHLKAFVSNLAKYGVTYEP